MLPLTAHCSQTTIVMASLVSRADGLVYLDDIKPRTDAQRRWERQRRRHAHWFSECAGEFVSRLFMKLSQDLVLTWSMSEDWNLLLRVRRYASRRLARCDWLRDV